MDRRCDGPSWVPDIATPIWKGIESLYQFSSGASRICFTHSSSDVLEITGLKCATVVTTTSAVTGNNLDSLQLVQSWKPPDMETVAYVTGDPLSDVFARTLLRGRLLDWYPGSIYTSLKEWKASCGNGLFGHYAKSATEESSDPEDPFHTTTSLGNYFYRSCLGRSFVTTQEGYIGLGPSGVEPGLGATFSICFSCILSSADATTFRRYNLRVPWLCTPTRPSSAAWRPLPARG